LPLQAGPTEKARVHWQTLEWEEPFIVGREQPNQSDAVRGLLRGNAMAFSGWERAGRAVFWDGSQQKGFHKGFLSPLCDSGTDLTPPWPDLEQVAANLKQWLACSLDENHPLPDLLAIGDGQVDFATWLLWEPHRLQPWAVLSCLRNVVVHGTLSHTKAQQWGLIPVFEDGVAVLNTLCRRRLAACSGLEMLIDG